MKPIKEKETSKDGIIEITGGWSDFTYPNQKLSFWGTYPKQEQTKSVYADFNKKLTEWENKK